MNQEQIFVKKIINGNKKATRLFYQTYQPRLLNFILKRVSNPKDAEEILQDTFVSGLDSLPLFAFRSSLFSWLIGICQHEIVDFYRRKKIKTIVFSRLPFLQKIVDQALGPELTLQEKEMKQRIYSTLKSLNEGNSQILRLKYIDGLTLTQIAKKLGKTVKAAESYLFRARLAFQKQYVAETQNSKLKTPACGSGYSTRLIQPCFTPDPSAGRQNYKAKVKTFRQIFSPSLDQGELSS